MMQSTILKIQVGSVTSAVEALVKNNNCIIFFCRFHTYDDAKVSFFY